MFISKCAGPPEASLFLCQDDPAVFSEPDVDGNLLTDSKGCFNLPKNFNFPTQFLGREPWIPKTTSMTSDEFGAWSPPYRPRQDQGFISDDAWYGSGNEDSFMIDESYDDFSSTGASASTSKPAQGPNPADSCKTEPAGPFWASQATLTTAPDAFGGAFPALPPPDILRARWPAGAGDTSGLPYEYAGASFTSDGGMSLASGSFPIGPGACGGSGGDGLDGLSYSASTGASFASSDMLGGGDGGAMDGLGDWGVPAPPECMTSPWRQALQAQHQRRQQQQQQEQNQPQHQHQQLQVPTVSPKLLRLVPSPAPTMASSSESAHASYFLTAAAGAGFGGVGEKGAKEETEGGRRASHSGRQLGQHTHQEHKSGRKQLPDAPVRYLPILPSSGSGKGRNQHHHSRHRSGGRTDHPSRAAASSSARLPKLKPKHASGSSTATTSHQHAVRSSSPRALATHLPPPPSSLSPGLSVEQQRNLKDDFLLKSKMAGLTYKQIRRQGGYTEAESTLRGRYRTLTKTKEARVRKPEWTEEDVRLLKKAVRKLANGDDIASAKVPWKKVGEYIVNNGGSYHFGNATCRKKWDEIVAGDGSDGGRE